MYSQNVNIKFLKNRSYLKFSNEFASFIACSVILFYLLFPIHSRAAIIFPSQINELFGVTYLLLFILGFFLLKRIFSYSNYKVTINHIDILLFLFTVFFISRYLLQNQEIDKILIYEFVLLIILYLISKSIKQENYKYILFIFPICGLIQILYGIKSQTGYFTPGYGLSDISGTFGNSGIFGGFIALAVIITCGLITNKIYNYSNSDKNIKYFELFQVTLSIILIILIIQLITTNSRSAWLASIFGITFLVVNRYNLWSKFLVLQRLWKGVVLLVFVSGLVTLFIGLYHFKKESADGRLLIWKVSKEMIIDKPLFGYGIDGFQQNYMNYQANYFIENQEEFSSYLADDNPYAFNEFLKITVEQGIIGLFFVISIIYILYFRIKGKTKKDNEILNIIKASILILIVFGMFSYPLAFFQFKVIAVFFLALSGKFARNFQIDVPLRNKLSQRSITVALFTLISCTGLYFNRQVKKYSVAYKSGNYALTHFSITSPAESIAKLELAYSELKNNGMFLSNFGIVLNKGGRYDDAIKVLKRANNFFPNSRNYIELGKSYEGLEQYCEAEDAWQKASLMVPNRFTPDYLWVKMLIQNGEIEEAKTLARQLIKKDVKIWSSELHKIINEMNSFVNQGESISDYN